MPNFENFYQKNFDRHLKLVKNILYKDKESAYDIVQEAYEELFKRWEEYDPKKSSLYSWSNSIVYNKFRNFVRNSNKESKLIEYVEDFDTFDGENTIIFGALPKLIQEYDCSDRDRAILWDKYVWGNHYAHVAESHGVSNDNVRQICFRFRRWCFE